MRLESSISRNIRNILRGCFYFTRLEKFYFLKFFFRGFHFEILEKPSFRAWFQKVRQLALYITTFMLLLRSQAESLLHQ